MQQNQKKKPAFLNLRTIITAIFAIAGIIAIVVDVAKDFLPDYLSMIITFVTALISMYSIMAGIMDAQRANEKHEDSVKYIKDLLTSFGVNVNKYAKSKNVPQKSDPAMKVVNDLLYVTAKSMHKSSSVRQIDGSNKLITNYYVYTLSSSHIEEQLNIMSGYMAVIVRKICATFPSDDDAIHIPVLILPYARNILLGEHVANSLCIPILNSQLNPAGLDTFQPVSASEDPYEHLYQTFIGIEGLEQCLKHAISGAAYNEKEIVFHGIVVDCNVTRGSQAIKVAKYLNENILPNGEKLSAQFMEKYANLTNPLGQEIKIRFERVENFATLFIADNKALPALTKAIKDSNFKLWYYYALSEETKSAIYNIRQSITTYDESSPDMIEELKPLAEACGFATLPKNAKCDNRTAEDMVQLIS